MSRPARPAARFRLAPVGPTGAAWDQATDLLVAPIRLAKPVLVALPGGAGGAR